MERDALASIKKEGSQALQYMNDSLRAGVSKPGTQTECIGPVMASHVIVADREFMLRVVRSDGCALHYASAAIQARLCKPFQWLLAQVSSRSPRC